MEQIILSWSGGKDSALSLYRLLNNPDYEVIGLMTAFSGLKKKVNLHYTHYELIKAQSDSIGLPLFPIYLSETANNKEYEQKHAYFFNDMKSRFIRKVAFGDIFLQPIREYRDGLLRSNKIQGVYPLWGNDTKDLAREFSEMGFKAKTTAVDLEVLSDDFLFKDLNEGFFENLPEEVDPCGENGEYHSFVYDAPYFDYPLNIVCDRIFEKDFRPKIEMNLKVCQLLLDNSK